MVQLMMRVKVYLLHFKFRRNKLIEGESWLGQGLQNKTEHILEKDKRRP